MSTPAGMIPQQGMPGQQAQQVHPTVSYGQPGGQQAQVIPTGPQQGYQPQVQHQQQQGFSNQNLPAAPQQGQPQQQVGTFGVPLQPNYPQQQQMQQNQQPQQGQPYNPQQPVQPVQQYPQQGQQQQVPVAQLSDDMILDGPGVPQELRGRRWGQVKNIYGTMRQAILTPAQQAQAARQQGQPQAQQQPAQQQQAPAGQQQNQQVNWQDAIRGIIREEIAPIQQQTTGNAVRDAVTQASQLVPDWADLEADVLVGLQGADPRMLADPQTFIRAADMLRGERMRTGGYQQQRSQYQQPVTQMHNGVLYQQTAQGWVPVQQQTQNGQMQMQRSVPAQAVQFQQPQYNPPQQHQFFTEGPSAPSMQNTNNFINTAEQNIARKMGLSDEEYVQWRGGVVR